jgi:hypothetical protein
LRGAKTDKKQKNKLSAVDEPQTAYCFLPGHGLHEPIRPYAQENPDLEEQPESAPAGALLDPLDKRLLKDDICFLTFFLPHFLHTTLSASEIDETKVSNTVSQSLQRYS